MDKQARGNDLLMICASPRAKGTSMMLLQRVQAAAGGQQPAGRS